MDHNKFNFVIDGESKLPPGFIFEPTDEEIVFQYLARKIFSFPLPATVIPEIDTVVGLDPWSLPGGLEQDKYFFCNKECNYRDLSGGRRATCGGYWRAIGYGKKISCSRRKLPIVGIKRAFVFYKGKHSYLTRTDWFMHLHSIAVQGNSSCGIQPKRHSSKDCLVQIGKWDLCHIFMKKRGIKSELCGHNGRLIWNYESSVARDENDADSSCASTSSSSSSDSDTEPSVLSDISSKSVNS